MSAKFPMAALCECSTLLGLHCTAVLRHDETGQEVLLNLLLRNYLHYNLYDQVRPAPHSDAPDNDKMHVGGRSDSPLCTSPPSAGLALYSI